MQTDELFVLPDAHDYVRINVPWDKRWPEDRIAVHMALGVSFNGGRSYAQWFRASIHGMTKHTAWKAMGGDGPWSSIGGPVRLSAGRVCRLVVRRARGVRADWFGHSEYRGIVWHRGQQPQSVAFDAVASTDFAAVNTASWTHTPSGTPTGVGVGIASAFGTGVDNTGISTVTYAGTNCTSAVTLEETTTAVDVRSSIWGLPNPTSGAQTVAVTWTNAALNHYGAAGSITVVGGDTTTLFSNTASGGAGSGNASLNCTTASDELVMDCIGGFTSGGPTFTVGSGQTERWNRKNAGSSTRGACSTQPGSTENPAVMTWTVSAGNHAITAASFKAAAAAGGRGKLMSYQRNRLIREP